jgi:glycosyltransferase involved in cell wall biosynthesis
MDASIIVCTLNRSKALHDLLKSIKDLEVPAGLQWEIVAIDNDSSDDTRSVVQEFAKSSGLNVRYYLEARRGKSFALNTGISEATGEILAFTDDDCILPKNWLAVLVGEFAADPELSGLGGRVLRYNELDRPVTIMKHPYREVYSPISNLGLIYGCNMAFRRRMFDAVGPFDVKLGPGTKTGAIFEDIDFVYRVYAQAGKIVYSPDLVVYHNHGRRTDTQVRSLIRKYAIGRGSFYCKHLLHGDQLLMRIMYWDILSSLRVLREKALKRQIAWGELDFLACLLKGAAYRFGQSAFRTVAGRLL